MALRPARKIVAPMTATRIERRPNSWTPGPPFHVSSAPPMKAPITPTTMLVMHPPPVRPVNRPAISAATNPKTAHEMSPMGVEARSLRRVLVLLGPLGFGFAQRFTRRPHPGLTALDRVRVEPPVGALAFLDVELLLQPLSFLHCHTSSVPKGCDTQIEHVAYFVRSAGRPVMSS